MRHVTPSPPPTAIFAFWLLGGLGVECAGKTVGIPGGKSQHLLAYLLLQADPERTRPAFITRDSLIDQLWPDMPASRARRTLSDTLYRLRRVLGDEWLYTDGDSLALTADNLIWVDVWAFESLANSTDTRDLETALALYRGDLLPEIYADWLLARRISLQEARQMTLLRLAEQEEVHQRYQQSHSLYTQLITLDPLREEAYRGLMRSLARMNRLSEALDTYARLIDLLESELDVPPSAETKRLADLLHRELEQARATTHPTRPLFVGRVEERARLVGRLDLARSGRGGLAVVMGEAGMGKTAMLNEIAQAAAWRNWQTYWGAHLVHTMPGPYSPLDRALRAATPTPRLQQIVHMVSPARLAPAAVLAPGIQHTLPAHVPADFAATPMQIADATEQILHCLQRIAPHLFLLEDCAQTSDDFWSLLDHISPALAQMRLLLVLSVRTDEVRRHPNAWSMITKWDRTGDATVIDLPGLNSSDLRALLAARGATLPDEQELAWLHAASGGNPLVARTTWEFDAYFLDHPPGPDSEKDEKKPASKSGIHREHRLTVDDLARRRVEALSPPARRALAGAAFLGLEIEYPIWHTLWQHIIDAQQVADAQQDTCDPAAVEGQESLPTLAGELEANNILHIRDDRYHFAHETLRVAAIDALPPSAHRRWHEAALAAVARHAPDDAARLFRHAIAAGAANAIVQQGIAAGDQALVQFDYQNAVQFYTHALEALPAVVADPHRIQAADFGTYFLGSPLGPDSEKDGKKLASNLPDIGQTGPSPMEAGRQGNEDKAALELEYSARMGRAEAYGILGETSSQETDLRCLQKLADRLGQDDRRVEVCYRAAHFYWRTGRLEQAQTVAEQGLALVESSPQQGRKAAILEVLGRITRDRKQPQEARAYVEQAHAIYRTEGNQWGEALTLDILGGLAWDAGDYSTAAERHREAADLFHAEGDIVREAQALNNLGSTYWALGAYGQARATHERSLIACRAAGNRRSEADNIDNLGGVAWVLGDYDTAIEYYEDALSIRRAIDDTWGVAISLGNLGSAYRLRGDPDQALEYYDQALPLYHQVGRRRSEAYVMHNRGATLLEMAQHQAAIAALDSALEIRREIGDRNSIAETLALLALAHHESGAQDTATATIEEALAILQTGSGTLRTPASLRREIHFHAYWVYRQTDEAQAMRHLGLAQIALEELCAPLSQEDSQRLRENVPISRRLREAVETHSICSRVRLARIDAPLGRKLQDDETTDVRWTIHAPQDCLLEDDIQRRRTVLQRLAAEAQEQGALPTDHDLAQALDVSRRTILRDIEALAAQNILIATRSRN